MRFGHLVIGLVFVAVFLATGMYMRMTFPDPADDDVGRRMLARSAHVYILLTALINLTAGLYLTPRPAGWRRWLQLVGSVLVLPAPALLTMAFFVEPAPQVLDRPIAANTIILAYAGVLLHAVAAWRAPPS